MLDAPLRPMHSSVTVRLVDWLREIRSLFFCARWGWGWSSSLVSRSTKYTGALGLQHFPLYRRIFFRSKASYHSHRLWKVLQSTQKKSRVHAAHMHVLRLLERKYRERIWFMAPACGKKSPRCAGWKYFCTYISLCTAVDLACFCYFHCCSTKAKIKWFVQLSKAPRVVQAEITLQKWKTARL